MAKLVTMAGTVRSVNGVEPDENANVTIPQVSILQAYPIGSIYMSVVETNPAELFGGTWEAIAPGRVLLGAGEYNSSTSYTAGATGGSTTRTLTSAHMPKHTHDVEIESVAAQHSHRNGVFDEVAPGDGPLSTNYGSIQMYPTGSQHVLSADSSVYGTSTQLYMGYTSTDYTKHTHGATVSSSGNTSPSAFNIMQPYLVVHMWKRTA